VLADVPDTGRFEGIWDPMARSEGEAVHDVIEYVAQQRWCRRKIGTIGQSYFCWTVWNIARTCPPHLTTVVAFDGATDHYQTGCTKAASRVASWRAGGSVSQ
jgi:uncharacterized protein